MVLDAAWLHWLVALVHALAGLFWLGWMLFIFAILAPALREHVPDRVQPVMGAVRSRVRSIVGALIVVLLATGAYNMYYRRLFNLDLLLYTGYGQRFLVKLAAAFVLFGIYLAAPRLLGHSQTAGPGKPWLVERLGAKRASLALHVVAFAAGTLAALLGISLGG